MSEATAGRVRRIGIAGLVTCALICVSLALGLFAAAGQYVLDADWYAYAVLGFALLTVVLLVGNTPRFLAMILIVTMPLGIYFELFARRDFTLLVSSWDLAAWALILLAAVRSLDQRAIEVPRLYLGSLLPFLGLIAVSTLSVAVADDRTSAVFATYTLVRLLVVCVAVLVFVKGPDDIRFIVDLAIVMLFVYGVKYIAENLLGVSFDLVGRMEGQYQGEIGTFRASHPNDTGGSLACLCAVALARLLVEKRIVWRAVTVVALVAGLVALVLTQSRGSWLSFAAAGSVILSIASARGYLRVGGLIAIICIVLVIAGTVGDIAEARLTNDDKGTALSRAPLMKQAVYMIQSSWPNMILGVGAGNYAFEMEKYIPPGMGEFWEYTVHNVYLLVWAECGTLGFLMFLWFLWTYARRVFDNLRSASPDCQHVGFVCLGFLGVLASHMFFEPGPLRHVSGWMFAVTFGLLMASQHLCAARREGGGKGLVTGKEAGIRPGICNAGKTGAAMAVLAGLCALYCTTSHASETRIILRMDDSGYGRHVLDDGVHPPDAEITRRVMEIVAKHGANVTIGVIPNAASGSPSYRQANPQYARLSSCAEEVEVLRAGIASGHVEIALHGWTHEVRAIHDGHSSEFGGRPYEEQADHLAQGKIELERCLGIAVDTFIPPFNNHDRTTLQALQAVGFKAISSDPKRGDDVDSLYYVPSTTSLRDLMEEGVSSSGAEEPVVVNAVFHVFDFRESGLESGYLSLEDFDAFLGELAGNPEVSFTTIGREVADNPEEYSSQRSRLYAVYAERVERVAELLGLLGPVGGWFEGLLPADHVYHASGEMQRMASVFLGVQIVSFLTSFVVVACGAYAALRLTSRFQWARPAWWGVLAGSGLLLGLSAGEGVFGVVGEAGFGSRLMLGTSGSAGLFVAALLCGRKERLARRISEPPGEVRILLRMDDCGYGRCRSESCGDSLAEAEIVERVVEIVGRHRARLTLGVVPHIHDNHPWKPVCVPLSACPEECSLLKRIAGEEIVEIAQHGFSHESYRGQRSEFSGRSYDDQYASIKTGKEELEEALSMPITFFIPPWNRHDDNTLVALQELGFTAISASCGDRSDLGIVYIRATTDLGRASGKIQEALKRRLPALIVVVFHGWEFMESGSPMASASLGALDSLLDEICGCERVRFTSMGEEVRLAREKGCTGFSQRAYNAYHERVHRIRDLFGLAGPLGRLSQKHLPAPGVMYPGCVMRRGSAKLLAFEVVLDVVAFVAAFLVSCAALGFLAPHPWFSSMRALFIVGGMCVGALLVLDGVFGLVGFRGFGSRLTIAIVVLAGSLTGTILASR